MEVMRELSYSRSGGGKNCLYTPEFIANLTELEIMSPDFLDSVFAITNDKNREAILNNIILESRKFKIVVAMRQLIAKRNDLLTKEKKRQQNKRFIEFPLPLKLTESGDVMNTIENYLTILKGDRRFRGLKNNLLTHEAEIHDEKKGIRIWTDAHDADYRRYIETEYFIHSKEKADDAFRIMLENCGYHPIKDIIDNLQWDGVDRIGTLLHKHLNCDNTEYTRECSRLIFAGGIHRIYNPGCKFDDMIVLIGTKQGEGKSTFVRWLALEDRFFREVTSIEGKDCIEQLQGGWICEMGELLALTRAKEVEAVKSFISRLEDVCRLAYDRRTSKFPRQCIFIGTTNKEKFLIDKTGNRRQYPVKTNCSGYALFDNKEQIKADILQAWAEAKAKIDTDFMNPYANRKLTGKIREQQAGAVEDDYRIGMIEGYLDTKKNGETVCALELYVKALDNSFGKPTGRESAEIGLMMQSFDGWVKLPNPVSMGSYGKQRGWIKQDLSDCPFVDCEKENQSTNIPEQLEI